MSIHATKIAATALTTTGRLGRLLKKGTRLVLMTKIIIVWVITDSKNQPVRKMEIDE